MDKSAIKMFAIESRRQMIESVKYQASLIGITVDGISEPISKAEGMETYDYGAGTYSIYDNDIKKRENLIKEIENKGFNNVVEEVAYTWFNRIIAIRFMEVNDYLTTRTRVLSSETEGKLEPDIITEALDLDLDLDYTNDDKEFIFKLKDENKLDELFRFLFVKQCNKLNEILPGLFEKTDDYMELLLNISFTNNNGIISKLISDISEEDFGDQVEILGWLYQFYNTELKDETFKNIKKAKVTKDRIPAVTQLFTPTWIVKYMVENSLGRLWLENHPNDNLKNKWKYYFDEAEQESSVQSQLFKIKQQTKILTPQDISIIDPCMGSGHILVYAFEILMDIYISEGYTEKEASESILKYNLFGLDIDKRAYQLAYFAVMMKVRKYNRSIFRKDFSLNLLSIEESNSLKDFINLLISRNVDIKNDLEYIYDIFKDAKEYGSILEIKNFDFEKVDNAIYIFESSNQDLNKFNYKNKLNLLKNIINQSRLLYKQYDIVITNPPYMNSSGMNNNLKKYLKAHYPNSKSDLFAVFIEKCHYLSKENGFVAMITQQAFMFLKAYLNLRKSLIENYTIINMAHLGPRAFEEISGEIVQASSFINRKTFLKDYISTFHRLIEFNSEKNKEVEFFNPENQFQFDQLKFKKIPGNQYIYWISDDTINLFNEHKKLEEFAEVKSGLSSGDNDKFFRYWFETNINSIGFYLSQEIAKNSKFKWFPLNKGGVFRKWYGAQDYVVNWENDGFEIKNFRTPSGKLKSRPQNTQFYFKESLNWSRISSSKIGFRFSPKGFVFGGTCSSVFTNNINPFYLLGYLNSSICQYLINLISATLDYNVGDIASLPFVYNDTDVITRLVKENIDLCKNDWDDYEISWNFKKHPLLYYSNNKIEMNFNLWANYKRNQFNKLKENEIALNKIYSEIFDVEIDLNVENKNVSINLAELDLDIKSFISYAVGCMFGRYSLDNEGLQFAGGIFDLTNYSKFAPDDDNIIPVLDTEYFDDDIVGRFTKFVKVCFGEETLEENLDYIAGALNKKGNTSREVIRNYFLQDFFKDHSKIYKKCPIYWQFDSGKQNAFKCLIYMHRYDSSIVARVRTDYLHKTQKAIEQNVSHCENIIANSSNKSEISKATKDKAKYVKQLDEIKVYDEALRHMAAQNIEIDLDDGVKVNYAKFQKVEISIEGEKPKRINLLKNI